MKAKVGGIAATNHEKELRTIYLFFFKYVTRRLVKAKILSRQK